MALALLASIPLITLILYTNLEQRRIDGEKARASAFGVASMAARNHQGIILDTRAVLSVVSEVIAAAGGGYPGLGPFLARVLESHPHYSNIGFATPDGAVVASALPLTRPVNIADRRYFTRAINEMAFSIGDYQVGRITSAAAVNFGYPVLGPGRRLLGVAFAALPTDRVEAAMAASGIPEGYVVSIIDSNYTVLARHPGGPGISGKSAEGTELADILRGAPATGSEANGLDGVRRIYAFTELRLSDESRLSVIAGVPSSQAYAHANSALLRNILSSCVMLAVAVLLAIAASDRLILRRIKPLLDATRELASGRLGARARVTGSDELASLAAGFNEMAGALEARDAAAAVHLTRIARLNRIYAVLSAINGTIIRVRDRDELLSEACRIAVEHGGFAFAWAANKGKGHLLLPVAFAGNGDASLDILSRPRSEGSGETLAYRVLRENRALAADTLGGGGAVLIDEGAAALGYRSALSLPLRVEGAPAAVLSLYSVEEGFFRDKEEMKLLLELAADTSLGLEKIEKEGRLDYVSRYDTLTGVYNRWVFEGQVREAMTRARHMKRCVGMAVFDITDFSLINDTLGHRSGDAVLKAVAGTLSSSVREGDMVARLGSDVFGVLLADLANRDDAVTVVEKVMANIPRAVRAGEEEVFVGVATGVAVYPEDGSTPQELLKNAELALHSLKEGGTATAYFSPEIASRAKERRSLESELRYAVDRGELALNYQPIMDIGKGSAVGVEALLRWRSGLLGQVPPDKFIPVAEETGLITHIGGWVFEEALSQARRWAGRGNGAVGVGVNVSVKQLREPGFLDRVARAMGPDPAGLNLAIEITESELMENIDEHRRTLEGLRALGIKIYIDDFGTGYSSLSYLKSLPVDVLKIDRSFIKDIDSDRGSFSMARAIIAIGRSLGLEVIAEGVETPEQLVILKGLGCSHAQGFLFSRPGAAAEIEGVLFGENRG